MFQRRGAAVLAAVGFVPLLLAGPAAVPAMAHGSTGSPAGRVSPCSTEGPAHSGSPACRAAGGTQALHGRSGARMGDTNGRHHVLVPDGEQCGCGSGVGEHGHGGSAPDGPAGPPPDEPTGPASDAPTGPAPATGGGNSSARPTPANLPKAAGTGRNLAETGGGGSTSYQAIGGAAALALGAAALFASVRHRARGVGRRGR